MKSYIADNFNLRNLKKGDKVEAFGNEGIVTKVDCEEIEVQSSYSERSGITEYAYNTFNIEGKGEYWHKNPSVEFIGCGINNHNYVPIPEDCIDNDNFSWFQQSFPGGKFCLRCGRILSKRECDEGEKL